eukprot:6105067-Prymnesium_polylepis.1
MCHLPRQRSLRLQDVSNRAGTVLFFIPVVWVIFRSGVTTVQRSSDGALARPPATYYLRTVNDSQFV